MCTHEGEQTSYHVQAHCSCKNVPAELLRAERPLERVGKFDTSQGDFDKLSLKVHVVIIFNFAVFPRQY